VRERLRGQGRRRQLANERARHIAPVIAFLLRGNELRFQVSDALRGSHVPTPSAARTFAKARCSMSFTPFSESPSRSAISGTLIG